MSVVPLSRPGSPPDTPPHALPGYLPFGPEIELFESAAAHGLAVLLKGPTGCGKTRFVEHMAARLGRELITVSCHDDLSAADLVGRHLIGADGTYWSDGPLTRAVRTGAICYLDEVVEARKDTTVILHSLSDNRRMLPLERTGELLAAPPEFMLVVSYNPGYQQTLKGLKPSTRQRFVSLSFDFPDAQREAAIVMQESGVGAEPARRLVALARALRASAEYDLDEAPGTRLLVHAGRLMASGIEARLACRVGLLECLSDDPGVIGALGDVVTAVFDA